MAQQKHEATFVGLDIGTSKVVCLVGLHQQDLATPSIIGLGVAPVSGLKRGVVTDVEETVSAITAALEEAERMSGVVITKASINAVGIFVYKADSAVSFFGWEQAMDFKTFIGNTNFSNILNLLLYFTIININIFTNNVHSTRLV